MGIWVLTVGCAGLLLALTATAAAILCRSRVRLVFWIPMGVWWLAAAGALGTIAFGARVLGHERFAYPDYFPQALSMALVAGLGIPVLTIRSRLRLFGRPDGENWPILPLVSACAVLLIVNVVTFMEMDGSAQSLVRMVRPQVDGKYVRLLGPDPAAQDNAADLYQQAFALCKQAIEAADQETKTAVTAAPADGLVAAARAVSEQIGRAEYASSPQVVGLVGRLQPAVQLARLAAVRPACRMERIDSAPGAARLLPDLSGFRQLACVLYSDALVAAREGRGDDVLSDVIAMRMMEQHVLQGDHCLVTALVSVGIGELTNSVIAEVLPLLPRAPEHMESLVRDDAAIRGDLVAQLRGEELGIVATLLDTADGKLDGARAGQPSARESGMGFGGGLYRVLYLRTDLEGVNQVFDAAIAPLEERQVELPWRDLEHARLSMQAKLLVPPVASVTKKKYPQYVASSRCAALCIALTRYRVIHGEYPASLGQLVPAYLASVPVDPFDQQPMRYRLEGGIAVVYSVGPDGKDDGGKIGTPEGNSREAEDVGLELRPVARP